MLSASAKHASFYLLTSPNLFTWYGFTEEDTGRCLTAAP
jgi:hypothetical protein